MEDYWSTGKSNGNEKTQNIIILTRFQLISQNHEFYNNDKDEKSDKLYKICYVIQHLNIYFARSLGNSPFQSVDGYLCKFKGRSSMRQDIKNKPTK